MRGSVNPLMLKAGLVTEPCETMALPVPTLEKVIAWVLVAPTFTSPKFNVVGLVTISPVAGALYS